jgi:hypothetical protein
MTILGRWSQGTGLLRLGAQINSEYTNYFGGPGSGKNEAIFDCGPVRQFTMGSFSGTNNLIFDQVYIQRLGYSGINMTNSQQTTVGAGPLRKWYIAKGLNGNSGLFNLLLKSDFPTFNFTDLSLYNFPDKIGPPLCNRNVASTDPDTCLTNPYDLW